VSPPRLPPGPPPWRVGTRFATALESGAHPDYVACLLTAASEDTVLTEAFSEMWPHAPHRVLRSCIDAAEQLKEPLVGEIDWAGQTMPIPRFSVFSPTVDTRGRIECMALYAGQSVGAVTRRERRRDRPRSRRPGVGPGTAAARAAPAQHARNLATTLGRAAHRGRPPAVRHPVGRRHDATRAGR
jgi:hypothetical protein